MEGSHREVWTSESETVTEGETPGTVTSTFSYDADNRLISAEGKTGDTVDYTQNNEYNGFGQRIKKTEGTEETNYFYDGTSVLYTTDATNAVTAFNIIGAEDNILTTARYDGDAVSFYTYTKDLRESTVNLVGSDGTAKVSYEYTDYGETEIFGDETFYNEVCHGAGIYDKTTGLYYLNARHYDPEDAIFMSQDTYRGDRSRTATLNYYAYCAGNPINYTDPSGHAFWGIIGAAMGAYDGYKYAKKKKLSGWKKAAVIVGGAALGAVNPCKVAKAAKKVYKFAKSARKAYKAAKTAKKAKKIAKASKAKKLKSYKKVNKKTKKVKAKKSKKISNSSKKSEEYVTYRRVQGGSGTNSSQERIVLNDDGTISIADKNKNLSISIDNGEHSSYFAQKRGGNVKIIEFDVPKWFDEFLKENTIPQYHYSKNPLNQGGTAPKLSDPSTPGNSYELPSPWIEWLEEYAVNARIKKP